MRFGGDIHLKYLIGLLIGLVGWSVASAQTPVGSVVRSSLSVIYADAGGAEMAVDGAVLETGVLEGAKLLPRIEPSRDPAAPGDTLVWNLTVRNVGNAPARGVIVRNALTGDFGLLDADGGSAVGSAIAWEEPIDIGPGAELALAVVVRVDSAAPLESELTSSIEIRGLNVEAVAAAAFTTVRVAREPNLELSIRADAEKVEPGESFSYRLSYFNRGSAPGRLIRLADHLPRPLEYIDALPRVDQRSAATLLWAIDELPPGAGGEIELQVRVRDQIEPGTQIENRTFLVSLAGWESGLQLESPLSVVKVVTPYMPPVFEKSVAEVGEPVETGNVILYRLIVDNDRGHALERATLRDTLNPALLIEGVEARGVVKVEEQVVEVVWEPLERAGVDTVLIRTRVRADRALPMSVGNVAWLETPFAVHRTEQVDVRLRGIAVDGELEQADEIMVGEPLSLRVVDADRDRNPTIRDSLQVEVANLRSGERESVWLTEVDTEGGVFAGELATRAATDAPIDADGMLRVAAGDSLRGTYVDSLGSDGGSLTLTAETLVLDTQIDVRADPAEILANGEDRSQLTARVTDTRGRPLPPGLEVTFIADLGTFADGSQQIVVPVAGKDGEAQVIYVSPLLAGQTEARVVAIFGGIESAPIRLQVFPGAGAIRVFDQVRGEEVTAADPDLSVEVRLEGETVEGERFELMVTVDQNGLYVIPDIPPGRYQLLARVAEINTGRVISDGKLQDIVVEADGSMTPPANSVSGTLKGKRDKSGARYAGATVEIVDETGSVIASAVVDDDGGYDFQNLPPGRYELRATLPDGTTATAEVSPRSVASGSVIVNADILIDPFGLVFDAESGAAVPDATVALRYLTGDILPIPLLDGIGAAPNVDNINPFVSTEKGRYAFLFGGDQVGRRGAPVEYFLTVEPPIGSDYLERRFRIQVEPETDDPLDVATITMLARSEDGLMLARPNDVSLTPDPIFVPNIETIAFNIPLFSRAAVLLLEMVVQADSAAVGDQVDFLLIAANEGNVPVGPVTVVDTLGADWKLLEAVGGSATGDVAVWEIPELTPGARDTLRLRAELTTLPSDADRLVEQAWLRAGEMLPVRATDELVVRRPSWLLEKRASTASAGPGQKLVYTLAYRNGGTAVGSGATLVDSLPGSLEPLRADGGLIDGQVVIWPLNELAPGQIDSVQLIARLQPEVEVGLPVVNVAELVQMGETQARAIHQLHTRPLEVELRKVVDREHLTPGERGRYSLTLATGRDSLSGWTVRDTLPAELSYVTESSSAPVRYDSAAHSLEWEVDALPADGELTFDFAVESAADLAPGEYFTRNQAVAQTQGLHLVSDPAELVVTVAYFEVEISVDQPVVEPGDIVVYRVGLKNTSRRDSLAGIRLTVLPPKGFDYVGKSGRLEGEKILSLAEGGTAPVGKKAAVLQDSSAAADERALEWYLPGLSANRRVELSFQVVAGAGALESDGLVSASAVAISATGFSALTSNVVRIRVRVRPSALFSLGQLIVGRVWIDRDEDGAVDRDEPPVAGAVLVADDGTRLIADDHGRFSLPELEPGDRVLRLLKNRITSGMEPVPGRPRALGDGWSRLLSPGRAGMIKANFPLRYLRKSRIERQIHFRSKSWLARRLTERPLPSLSALHFASGAIEVDAERKEMLTALAAYMLAVPDLKLAVEGHADAQPIATERFSDNANLALARARSAAAVLIAADVDSSRLQVRSLGAERPVADNATDAGRYLNRRVELIPLEPVPSLYDLTLQSAGPRIRLRQQKIPPTAGSETLTEKGTALQLSGLRLGVDQLPPPQRVEDPSRPLVRAGSDGRGRDLWWLEGTSSEPETVYPGMRLNFQLVLTAERDGRLELRLPRGVEATDTELRWNATTGDTLEREVQISIAPDFSAPQLELITAFVDNLSERLLTSDSLRVPVDTRPLWEIAVRHVPTDAGQIRRTVALTYLGAAPLSRAHLTERLPDDLEPIFGAEEPRPLRAPDGFLWTWEEIEPNARLEVTYELSREVAADAILPVVSCGLQNGLWIDSARVVEEGGR